MSDITGNSSVVTPPSDGGGGGGKPKQPKPPGKQQTVRHPNYNAALFDKYCQMRLRHPQLLRKVSACPPASPHYASIEMCLSFHVKGICNTCCSRAADHLLHTPEQDANLVNWCTKHYKKENE